MLNEMSNKVVGFDIATKKNYFPILTDWLYTNTKEKRDVTSLEDFVRNIRGLLVPGPLKTRIKNAQNAIVLEGFSKAMGRTQALVIDYIGMADTIKKLDGLMRGEKESGNPTDGFVYKVYDSEIHDNLIQQGQVELINTQDESYVDLTDDSTLESINDIPGVKKTLKLNQVMDLYDLGSEHKVLNNWLRAIKKDVLANEPDVLEHGYNKLLGNYATGLLAKPNVALKQIMGFPNYFINQDISGKIKNKGIVKATLRSFLNQARALKGKEYNKIDAEIKGPTGSPVLANRITHVDRLTSEFVADAVGREAVGIKTKGFRKLFSPKILLHMMIHMDTITTRFAWEMAKNNAEINGFEKGSNEYWEFVRDTAEAAIRRTQPSTATIDRPEFFNRKDLVHKTFAFLQGQSAKNFMASLRLSRIATSPDTTLKQKSTAMTQLFNVLFAQPILLAAMDSMYRTIRGAADWDDVDKEALIFAKNFGRYMFGSLGILANAGYEFTIGMLAGEQEPKVGETIVGDLAGSLARAIRSAVALVQGNEYDNKGRHRLHRIRREISNLLAALGWPSRVISDTIDIGQNIIKVANGD
jgi:hypothetical protein